jgi:hypothetical protein
VSDGLVLELVSANTVETLSNLAESKDGPTVTVLALVLLFTRLHLFGVNATKLDARNTNHMHLFINAVCD